MNIFTVQRFENRVNISGEKDTLFHGKMATLRFENELRNVLTDADGREYFKLNNDEWYIDELDDMGIDYIA